MHTLEFIKPVVNREITREDWEKRLEWAYALGFRDGVHEALSEVTNMREAADQREEDAFRAHFRYLEERDKKIE